MTRFNTIGAPTNATRTDRNTLLQKGCNSSHHQVDSQSVFVTIYHPKLQNLSSILRKNFHFIKNDSRLNKIFNVVPLVAFKKMKSIRNFVVHNDVQCRPKVQNVATSPCGKCKKTCLLISKSTEINNSATKRKLKVADPSRQNPKSVYEGVFFIAICMLLQ